MNISSAISKGDGTIAVLEDQYLTIVILSSKITQNEEGISQYIGPLYEDTEPFIN